MLVVVVGGLALCEELIYVLLSVTRLASPSPTIDVLSINFSIVPVVRVRSRYDVRSSWFVFELV